MVDVLQRMAQVDTLLVSMERGGSYLSSSNKIIRIYDLRIISFTGKFKGADGTTLSFGRRVTKKNGSGRRGLVQAFFIFLLLIFFFILVT